MNGRAWIANVTMITWVFVVISALMVVYCKHTLRTKVSELQMLGAELDNKQVELGQLMLEQGTVASYDRIEQYASKQLNMRAPHYDEVVWIERPDS